MNKIKTPLYLCVLKVLLYHRKDFNYFSLYKKFKKFTHGFVVMSFKKVGKYERKLL